jgi:hypothetical protein
MFHKTIRQEVIMKKIFAAVAAVCCLAAAPAAFAGVDIFVDLGVARPLIVAPPAPVVYYERAEPRWHDQRRHFGRHHETRDRHQHFRRHDRR